MKSSIQNTLALAAVATVALPVVGQAAVNYGDFVANTVVYKDVTESANSPGDTEPLYGAPSVSGNTLDFNPVGFFAAAADGASDLTIGNLGLAIESLPGNFIDEIEFEEEGDFALVGPGTDATYVDVSATFRMEIKAVDGVGIDPISTFIDMTFTPNGTGTFELATDGGGAPFLVGDWSGKVNFDLDAILNANQVTYEKGATLVTMNIDNILIAGSEIGTQSSIEKKDFKGFSITVVPEPTSAALALLGLAGLTLISRKKNNH